MLVAGGLILPGSVVAVDTAAARGALPPSVAQRYYDWEAASLTAEERGQFGGRWRGEVTSDAPMLADGTSCGGGPVEMLIAGQRLVGVFRHSEEGYTLQVQGALDASGAARGGIAQGDENYATWDAAFGAHAGTGRWSDAYGCAGGFAVARDGAGEIVSTVGRVLTVRGIRTLPAVPGMQVYGGDVVVVEQGAQAVLDLAAQGRIALLEQTRFDVPGDADPEPSGTVGSFLGSGWTRLKRLLQGETFEIKTPTAVAGVRG